MWDWQQALKSGTAVQNTEQSILHPPLFPRCEAHVSCQVAYIECAQAKH